MPPEINFTSQSLQSAHIPSRLEPLGLHHHKCPDRVGPPWKSGKLLVWYVNRAGTVASQAGGEVNVEIQSDISKPFLLFSFLAFATSSGVPEGLPVPGHWRYQFPLQRISVAIKGETVPLFWGH